MRRLLAVAGWLAVAVALLLPLPAFGNPQGPIIRGGDGRLYQLAWSGSYNWGLFSPEVFQAPAGMAHGSTEVDHLFVVGSDGRIYEKTWSPATGWSIWNLVGDGVATSAPAAAMSRGGDRTDLFVRGTDNAIWHNTRHAGTGGRWAGWYQVPGSVGATSAPTVVATPSGELDLFIRGSDGQIYHKYGTDAAGWGLWNLIGPGVVKSAPTAIRRSDGVIEVYVRGSDDRVYQKTKAPGGGWSIWNAIGANGLITAGPWAYVDQSAPGLVEVLARGNDGYMYRYHSGGWNFVGAPSVGAAPDPSAYGLTLGPPTSNPYPNSARFGGPNGAIDTDAERSATIAAVAALPGSGAPGFWQGANPAELDGIRAFVVNRITEEAGSLQLGDIRPLTPAERDALGVSEAAATTAAYGTYGCRRIRDYDRKYKVDVGIDDAVTVTSDMFSDFCWNKVAHKASLPGQPPGDDTRVVDPTVSEWAEALGISVDKYTRDQSPFPTQRSWNGYPKGEIAMSMWFDIDVCFGPIPKLGACIPATAARMYHAVYGHYDGTATARMRRR